MGAPLRFESEYDADKDQMTVCRIVDVVFFPRQSGAGYSQTPYHVEDKRLVLTDFKTRWTGNRFPLIGALMGRFGVNRGPAELLADLVLASGPKEEA
jgi:hypothetical protein